MRILALDAAGERCGAALFDGETCLAAFEGGDSRQATAALPLQVSTMFDDHGRALDGVGVTVGPGSFTGLRGAIAFAQGVAFADAVPVVGVTVAEALLDAVRFDGPVWVALDGRREGRIFLDTGAGMAAVELDALPQPPDGLVVIGDGAALVCGRLGQAASQNGIRHVALPAVAKVAARRLRGEIAPCEAQPLYLEPPAVRPPRAE